MQGTEWAVSDTQLDNFWYCYLSLQTETFPDAPNYDFDDENLREKVSLISFARTISAHDLRNLADFVPFFPVQGSGHSLEYPLQHVLLRSDPQTVLETAIDLCHYNSLIERKDIPFEAIRKALFLLRRFSRGYENTDSVFRTADEIEVFNPSDYKDSATGLTAHMFPRVLVIAVMIASEIDGKIDRWHSYAEILSRYQTGFHGADAPQGLSLAQRLYPVFYYMGRRGYDDRSKALISSRLRTRALELCLAAASPTDRIPNALTVGIKDALEYMRGASIFPAFPVDGSGLFCLPLDSNWKSKRDEPRRIAGYGFDSNGEAVYVIDKQPGLTHKRCWKANNEYTPDQSYIADTLEPHHNISDYYATRPDGHFTWPRMS